MPEEYEERLTAAVIRHCKANGIMIFVHHHMAQDLRDGGFWDTTVLFEYATEDKKVDG